MLEWSMNRVRSEHKLNEWRCKMRIHLVIASLKLRPSLSKGTESRERIQMTIMDRISVELAAVADSQLLLFLRFRFQFIFEIIKINLNIRIYIAQTLKKKIHKRFQLVIHSKSWKNIEEKTENEVKIQLNRIESQIQL